MATEKRQRQKEARQQKIAEVRRVEQRQVRKSRGLQIGLAVGAVIALAAIFSIVTNDDGEDVATDDTTATSDATDTSDPSATTDPEGPEITGTPPTTVPAGEPVEPTCPAADGSAEPAYEFTGLFEGCLEDGVDYKARFVTTKGDVLVDLREDEMPKTVESFVSLARYHYYDGTDLFRTDPSIDIIQGGSPHTQDNSDPGPGYNIPDEGGEFTEDPATGGLSGPFTYQAGQLIMARSSGPDSSGGQFFFSTGDNVKNLDSQGTYLLFGDVVEGLEVLQEIIGLHVEDPTSGLGGRPSEYVIVEEVEIIEG